MEDVVQTQYTRWVYPEPVPDLDAPDVRGLRLGSDPDVLGYAYWPDRPPRKDLHILIAGCGSSAAARMAFHHRDATVVGIDISSESLRLTRSLKQKHDLTNLTLVECRVEDVGDLEQTFDLIDCVGVLHHLPDPARGLQALGAALRPDGVIYIMLYGKYGRAGVYMLQEFFRRLGLEQSAADIATVKETLSQLPVSHPVRPYLSEATDLSFDAGLVDTFLHARDRHYTVADCLQLLKSANLAFQSWNVRGLYCADAMKNGAHLSGRLQALPEEQQWAAMELFNGRVGQHRFFACRTDRDPATYRIDISGDAILDLVPIVWPFLRRQREDNGLVVSQHNMFSVRLAGQSAVVFDVIDGKKSVREYGAESVDLIRTFWRVGCIFLVHRSAMS